MGLTGGMIEGESRSRVLGGKLSGVEFNIGVGEMVVGVRVGRRYYCGEDFR